MDEPDGAIPRAVNSAVRGLNHSMRCAPELAFSETIPLATRDWLCAGRQAPTEAVGDGKYATT